MKFFNLKKSIYIFSFYVLCGLLLVPRYSMAQYYSQSENKPKIVIDKKVRPITDKNFYDNISAEQLIFKDGDTVEFKILVENSGNQTLTNVSLVDILPNYLNLLFFPGIYNKTSNTINNQIGTLEPGQTKEYFIRAKIANLPTSSVSNKKLQQINKTKVQNDLVSDYDEAKYFVELKSIPTTGSSNIVFETVLVLGMVSVSIFLRKVSRGY